MENELAKKRNVVIIHDSYSDPSKNWYGWLSSQIKSSGFEAYLPKFPTPTMQTLESWDSVMVNHANNISKGTVFVGHGLGAAYVLKMIERLDYQVGDVYLIAPYITKLGHKGFDGVSETFLKDGFNWNKIIDNTKSVSVIYGNDDPYVPVAKVKELGDNLEVKYIEINKGGHLDEAFGYTEFPLLAEKVVASLKYMEPTPEEELKVEMEKSGVDYSKDKVDSGEDKEVVIPKSALNTYYSDMKKVMTSGNATEMAKLLRKERVQAEIRFKKKKVKYWSIFFGIAASLLVLSSLMIVFGARTKPAPVVSEDIEIASLVTNDYQTGINISNATNLQSLKTIEIETKDKPFVPGSIHDFFFVRDGGEEGLHIYDAKEFIDYFELPVSRLFLQDVRDSYMFGYYHGDKLEPFLVFKLVSYRRVLERMRDWETTMLEDLGEFFRINSKYLNEGNFGREFFDQTRNNQLTRVLNGEPIIVVEEEVITEGDVNQEEIDERFVKPEVGFVKEIREVQRRGDTETLLVYSFIREDTLVITTTLEAIDEIVERMINKGIFEK